MADVQMDPTNLLLGALDASAAARSRGKSQRGGTEPSATFDEVLTPRPETKPRTVSEPANRQAPAAEERRDKPPTRAKRTDRAQEVHGARRSQRRKDNEVSSDSASDTAAASPPDDAAPPPETTDAAEVKAKTKSTDADAEEPVATEEDSVAAEALAAAGLLAAAIPVTGGAVAPSAAERSSDEAHGAAAGKDAVVARTAAPPAQPLPSAETPPESAAGAATGDEDKPTVPPSPTPAEVALSPLSLESVSDLLSAGQNAEGLAAPVVAAAEQALPPAPESKLTPGAEEEGTATGPSATANIAAAVIESLDAQSPAAAAGDSRAATSGEAVATATGDFVPPSASGANLPNRGGQAGESGGGGARGDDQATAIDAVNGHTAPQRTEETRERIWRVGPHHAAHEQPGLTELERVRLVQRVASAMTTLPERGGEMRLRLTPPELGTLHMEVQLRDGILHARFQTENPTAQAVLIDSVAQLRERLADQEIRLGRYEVDLMQTPSGNQQSAQQQGFDDRRPAFPPSPRRETGGKTSDPPRPRPAAVGNLDVLV